MPDCDGAGTAERSYPVSEAVSGAAAGRNYPTPGAAGRRSYPTPPCQRPGTVAGRANPMSKEPWLHWCRRA